MVEEPFVQKALVSNNATSPKLERKRTAPVIVRPGGFLLVTVVHINHCVTGCGQIGAALTSRGLRL